MKTAKWSSNRYISEADKKKKRDLINLSSKIVLLIIWSTIMIMIGMSAGLNMAVKQEPKRPFFIYQKIRV